MDLFCYLCFVMFCCLFIAAVITCWESQESIQSNTPLGSLLCDVLLCFCHFPIWIPGSGVVLECIDF